MSSPAQGTDKPTAARTHRSSEQAGDLHAPVQISGQELQRQEHGGNMAADVQTYTSTGQQPRKTPPFAESPVPSPSSPNGTAARRIHHGQRDDSESVHIPLRRNTGDASASTANQRTSETNLHSPTSESGEESMKSSSLTEKVGTYLRRHSAEGVHPSLDMIRMAGLSMKNVAHGDDKEHTSIHAVPAIDPAIYY